MVSPVQWGKYDDNCPIVYSSASPQVYCSAGMLEYGSTSLQLHRGQLGLEG